MIKGRGVGYLYTEIKYKRDEESEERGGIKENKAYLLT